jgi:hypothetical protein
MLRRIIGTGLLACALVVVFGHIQLLSILSDRHFALRFLIVSVALTLVFASTLWHWRNPSRPKNW